MYRILHLHWLKSFISAEGGMCVLEEQHPGLCLFVWSRWASPGAATSGKDAEPGRAWGDSGERLWHPWVGVVSFVEPLQSENPKLSRVVPAHCLKLP